jgi:predicted N-formylglutamate amidohydrolase
MSARVIVTCEHGGNRVPTRFAKSFEGQGALLRTHRAYDLGAATVATEVARLLRARLLVATTTRLLVDLNRSPSHARLFSEFTRGLPRHDKERIVAEHYLPHRRAVERAIAQARARRGFVVHLAIHSFTPVLDGIVRRADVGLLYDPARSPERALCESWRDALLAAEPARLVRRNYPYRGTSDGLATALRREHGVTAYAGVEVEVNQRLLVTRRDAVRVAGWLAAAFTEVPAFG